MNNGYLKAATALLRLDAADRDWLLEQLPDEDRMLVRDAMVQIGAGAVAEDAIAAADSATADSAEEQVSVHDDERHLLQRADAAEMQGVLAAEPDWVVAAVLGHRVWPWGAEYLEDLPASKVERLAHLAEHLEARLTARARAEILDACASRLRREEPEPVMPSPFASMLASLRRAQPVGRRPADSEA